MAPRLSTEKGALALQIYRRWHRQRWRCKYGNVCSIETNWSKTWSWRFPLDKDDFHIDPECHGLRVSVDSWILFESYFNFMVLVIKLLKSNTSMNLKQKETKPKRQTQNCQSLNPRGSVSLTQPHRGGAPMRKQDGSILLSSAGRQVALATMPRYVGLKLGVLTFCLL